MTLEQDLLAEGEPEQESVPGVAARFPAKRVAAGALIRDAAGRLLLVQPTYRPWWGLPGGVVEAGEDPHTGCHREVLEELGLDLPIGGLLVVDWAPRHGVWGDSLQFVFDGGTLDDAAQARIRLQEDEIGGFAWSTVEEAGTNLRPSVARRLTAALDALESGRPAYLTYGRRP